MTVRPDKALALILVLAVLGTNTITSKASEISTIDYTTFKNNYGITSVHVGKDVDEITGSAFRNLANLRSITVSASNPFYASYGGCLYDKAMTELLCFPPALTGAYIPTSVVSIGANALHGVPEDLKQAIRDTVEGHASEFYLEGDVHGSHFVHEGNTVRWRMADGTIVSPYSNIMNLAAMIVSGCTDSSMKQSDQLERCFLQLVNTVTDSRSAEVPTGNWTKTYAQDTLTTGLGNSFGYAASFAYIARGLGYEARVCTGTVPSSNGGRTDHAWTEVKMGKSWYIFDAQMQDSYGSGYFKQTYEGYPAGQLEKVTIIPVDLD